MKSRDIVIVGIMLAIGAIVRFASLTVGGPITSNLVIGFYTLAILLIGPTILEALGIGIVAGIICMLISHSIFPPANLISEPIGAIVAVMCITGINAFVGKKTQKDNPIGLGVTAIGFIGMLVFAVAFAAKQLFDPKNAFGIAILKDNTAMIIFSLLAIVVTLVGLYFIPATLTKYKPAIVALIATIVSGSLFLLVAAFIIVEATGFINHQYLVEHNNIIPPVDAFLLASLPIVLGCAVINMIIAQVLYTPAKKAMR